MMGQQPRTESLFYYFRLQDQIPEDQLRLIARHIDFSFVREQLKDFYSPMGRPSIDPEVLLRLLLVGYLYGITSERRLLDEVRMHLAYRWFTRLGFEQEIPDHSTLTSAAQLALLSKLDSTDPAPNTIWIFTANDTERLERRFLSRCKVLDFSSYGLAGGDRELPRHGVACGRRQRERARLGAHGEGQLEQRHLVGLVREHYMESAGHHRRVPAMPHRILDGLRVALLARNLVQLGLQFRRQRERRRALANARRADEKPRARRGPLAERGLHFLGTLQPMKSAMRVGRYFSVRD
jgi:hypothetical protein